MAKRPPCCSSVWVSTRSFPAAETSFWGGLAHGLRIADVRKRYDSIVEYAGLQESMARPLKTYSSGMFSRLAFSISMHLDPDILLLDEVLAVGDQAFREKSLQAMRELLDRSGTIVFVSHNLENLAEFCDRAMWLQSGQVEMVGEGGEGRRRLPGGCVGGRRRLISGVAILLGTEWRNSD